MKNANTDFIIVGSKKSQNQMLLQHMTQYGSITSMEAYDRYGITRLSGRIYDLRNDGHIIKGTTETAINRFGKKVKFMRYKLTV